MAIFYFIWIIRIRIRLKGKRYPIQIQKNPNIRPDWTPKPGSCTPLVCTRDEHGSGLDRTGLGLKPIMTGSGLDRTAIFFKIGGSGLDRTEKIFVVFM